jgi:hypothetical protein
MCRCAVSKFLLTRFLFALKEAIAQVPHNLRTCRPTNANVYAMNLWWSNQHRFVTPYVLYDSACTGKCRTGKLRRGTVIGMAFAHWERLEQPRVQRQVK